MITRPAIQALMEAGLIRVTPDPVKIGPNSIDLRLGDTLKQYHPTKGRVAVRDPVSQGIHYAIDPKNPPPLIDVPKVQEATTDAGKHGDFGCYFDGMLPLGGGYEDCWLLVPGQFYLGATLEETYCRGVVPHLDGRSTCGRLSIEAHKTAGVGDNGFQGRWTLELEATEPVLVRPGDRLFQIYFTPAWGEGLAHLIHNAVDCYFQADICKQDPGYVDAGGLMQDGEPRHRAPLLEVNDLYGQDDGGHHYQGSKKVEGPSPLD
jgi:deoxycytidine triphosphate deaminase